MRIYRAVQKKLLNVFDGIVATSEKWMQSFKKTTKFMLIEMTKLKMLSRWRKTTHLLCGAPKTLCNEI